MKRFTRKLTVFAAALCLGALTLTACGSQPAAPAAQGGDTGAKPEVVNIGVQTLVTPELIARAEGIYEEYMGCKVNLVQFDSGADVNRAFASNSIEIGAVGTSPAAIGISTNLGYEIVWYHDVIGKAESLVATKASGITAVEDLVGKKVATPFASTAHYSLLNAISLAGVDPAQVELLDMQPDDIFAAWTRGDIDAAYVWDPVLSKLMADGVVVTDGEKLSAEGIVTADLCAVKKDFAEKYPDVVTGYVKAQIYGAELLESDQARGLKDIAEMAGITEEEAKAQVAGFIYPSAKDQITAQYLGTDGKPGDLAQTLKATADFLKEQKSIESAPELSAFEASVSGAFVEKALAGK